MATRRVLAVILIVLASLPSIAAADRSSFAFPEATLTMSSASWERSTRIEVSEVPGFRGSITKQWGTPRDPARRQSELMSWQFVGRSDHGDVYVFTFLGAGRSRDIVPVVFDGNAPVVIERHNVRIEISIPR